MQGFHTPLISSLADGSSLLFKGRALLSSIADNGCMGNNATIDLEKLRERLSAALKEKGMSARHVSLESGNGAGYVHSITVEGKEPKVTSLAAVCDVLGVSLSYILYGADISKESEQIIRLMEENPEKRAGILAILSS